MIFVYVVGTAGSGKSSLTRAFREWCLRNRYDAITVNLDPGVVNLPYTPDVDVREWISLEEVMQDYGLGPNGAQVVCADMLALNAVEVEERIREFRTEYVLMDTPGQLELFVFRSTGRVMVEQLDPRQSLLAFVIDPALATTPTNFVSQLMLSAITQFRMDTPLLNLLSKIDIVEKEALDMMLTWGKKPERLYQDVMVKSPTLHYQLSQGLLTIIKEMEAHTSLLPVSNQTLEGMEDLYTSIQHIFMGGEDLEPE
ncbi:MAG: ATP/GTP-binding protein [Candidatus Thermoplasmatota archaeon]|nr:ATP/GTP-binding protein [Candidatus Thermoplasmatota archaeon]